MGDELEVSKNEAERTEDEEPSIVAVSADVLDGTTPRESPSIIALSASPASSLDNSDRSAAAEDRMNEEGEENDGPASAVEVVSAGSVTMPLGGRLRDALIRRATLEIEETSSSVCEGLSEPCSRS